MKSWRQVSVFRAGLAVLVFLCLAKRESRAADPASGVESEWQIRVISGHPWRPPFGLDRVGQPIALEVESRSKPPVADYELVALNQGKEVARRALSFSEGPKFVARTTVDRYADDWVVSARKAREQPPVTLARKSIPVAELEVDAIARPDVVVNPVDLGTILVPSGWLLLGPKSSATLEVAAMNRKRDLPSAKLRTWFESDPDEKRTQDIPLKVGVRASERWKLPDVSTPRDRDALNLVLEDGQGNELWRKSIPVMRVAEPPRWPRFGATAARLRYDLPISVRDPASGTFSTLPYEKGWDPSLNDVVVSLPNGSRFVFWRGSSYIPFWAGRHNTGACYEWAEMISRPQDAVDCVEPLMDKDLRYGRVEIVESTPAHVHVRWSYQSTDLYYKVWGDSAVEDYHFYPDGFGTRVVSLTSDPNAEYELAELIILTPPETYPLAVLPENLVDALFVDGRKQSFTFPQGGVAGTAASHQKEVPAVYRFRLNKDEEQFAVSFNPKLVKMPSVVFGPFFDAGQMVTPCYWGSHWPLARGNATGNAIDDRVHLTPCHNSVMSWAKDRPSPLRTAEFVGLDALGRSRVLAERRWSWLIGMTDASDERLVRWAKSYATPPTLELHGAHLATEAYAPERRAIRLRVDGPEIDLTIKPADFCVNPVFELLDAPAGAASLMLAGAPLDENRFAWDGRTLWIDATISAPTELKVRFPGTSTR